MTESEDFSLQQTIRFYLLTVNNNLTQTGTDPLQLCPITCHVIFKTSSPRAFVEGVDVINKDGKEALSPHVRFWFLLLVSPDKNTSSADIQQMCRTQV